MSIISAIAAGVFSVIAALLGMVAIGLAITGGVIFIVGNKDEQQ